MQLVELQHIAGALASHDVAPFAISYDSVETLSAFAERNGIEYPLLADAGSKAIRRLGMLNEDLDAHHAAMGGTVRDDQRGVCYPGVFLLDEQGVVKDRRFQRNYRVRESGLSLLEQALNVSLPDMAPTTTAEGERVRSRRTSIRQPTGAISACAPSWMWRLRRAITCMPCRPQATTSR